MQGKQIPKVLPVLFVALGFSAVAFAAGSGTSGGTGGFVQPHEPTDAAVTGPAAVAQIQDASGGGAHNPVDDEGHRVNRTWVNNASTQLASGTGARNYVERDPDRFDALRADRAAATRLAQHNE